MIEELKPCPFCGGDAEFEHRQFEDNHWAPRDFWNVRVQCSKCDVKKSWYQYGEMEQRSVPDEIKQEAEQEAAVGWNSRPDASRIEELEQKLRTTSLEALAISDTNNELQARIVELEKERDILSGRLKTAYSVKADMNDEANFQRKAAIESQARLSEAVKVLEPFANQADTFDSLGGEEFVPDEFMPAIVDHTIGDLRKARAFITTLGGEKE